MPGTLVLVGAGEFLEGLNEVDASLLERAGGLRVAILPTASAPDGAGVPERWARMGIEHFKKLHAQPEAVMALTRKDCLDSGNAARVAEANFVYFSGGKPNYLYDALEDTPLWESVRLVLARGGVVAGCSAGAMIMGSHIPDLDGGWNPLSIRWKPGFGLLANSVIAPHYNEFPELATRAMFSRRPAETYLIGIDADTALVGNEGRWSVMGKRRVTLRCGENTTRFTSGQEIPELCS